jgi:hypothetical protein
MAEQPRTDQPRTDQPRTDQPRTVRGLTLRIREADVLESQLAPGDLEALAPEPVRCGGTYCERSYSNQVQ